MDQSDRHERMTYEDCPACWLVPEGGQVCLTCHGTGFVPTGLTVGQVEAAVEDARRLQHVRALALNLTAPSRFNGGKSQWACYDNPARVFRADTPRKAIDAAVNAALAKQNQNGAVS